jgi:hypothetical protein
MMEKDYLLPHVLPRDYHEFRTLMGVNVPQSYEEWRELIATRTREEAQRGDNVKDIAVAPAEFARFCVTVHILPHGIEFSGAVALAVAA